MSHPATYLLQAAVFGGLRSEETRAIRAHASGCSRCSSLVARDEEIRRRLATLRADEPRVDVLNEVLRRTNVL